MTLPAPQRQPFLAMAACPFAWDWMAAVTGPAGTRGCSLSEGQTFHDTATATNSAVMWPPDTSIGRVRITNSILRDRDPCALSDLIAETVRRNPEITAFHVRPSGAAYSSLLESLLTRLPSDHARIHSHYLAAHPGDAGPPTTLRFASTKPKPAIFAKEGWHKEAAKRKLFLFDPRQSGEETLPIYSLSRRSAWEWDEDGPGLTVPSSYAASGLLALPVTSTPLFGAHEDPLLELPSDCPTAVNNDPSQLAGLQPAICSSGLFLPSMRWRRRTRRHWRSLRSVGPGSSTTTALLPAELMTPWTAKWSGGIGEDTAKHPDGEEHIRLWDLPCLSAIVTPVKAKLEAILGKTLHVMTQGYIESITHVRQLPHQDFPAASLPVDGIALSVFWALSTDIPDDEVCAQFVAMSARAFPRPWIIHRMPMRRGSLWVIWSMVVHEGGSLPLNAEPGSRRTFGFCGLSTHTTPPRTRSRPRSGRTRPLSVVESTEAARSRQLRSALGVESNSFAAVTRGWSAASATLKQ